MRKVSLFFGNYKTEIKLASFKVSFPCSAEDSHTGLERQGSVSAVVHCS